MVDIVYHVCKSHFTSQFLPHWLDFTFFDVIGVEDASEWWDLGYAAARNECATTTLPVELCLWSPWNNATNIIYVVFIQKNAFVWLLLVSCFVHRNSIVHFLSRCPALLGHFTLWPRSLTTKLWSPWNSSEGHPMKVEIEFCVAMDFQV